MVDFRFFGSPRFSVLRSENTYFKWFWGLWTEKRGAPKTRKSTTTDPTPPSRPSDFLAPNFICSSLTPERQILESEMVAANRVAAINPPIDDADPIQKFSIDPGIHTNLQNPAEWSPKGKPIRNFSIDPASSIRTSIVDAIFADAISETSISQQTRVYPYPLVAGSARPNPKMGAPDPENPCYLGFSVLRGGPRPWSQAMVS